MSYRKIDIEASLVYMSLTVMFSWSMIFVNADIRRPAYNCCYCCYCCRCLLQKAITSEHDLNEHSILHIFPRFVVACRRAFVYTVFQKSDAKIQITITTAHLIRIKYPLSSFNYHLSGTNVANFNKIRRTVFEQQLFKKCNSKTEVSNMEKSP